jgi:excinuclease ABC subunit A
MLEPQSQAQDFITITGARTHNLKNISLRIPKGQLVVVTGLSGSGKSSLAFDTLYAEGQRRYVESLSAYARQFLSRMEKPDVDQMDGLSPAIAIEQKSTSHNPRSTVGTITEIADYLRLLFARAGTPHCPSHPQNRLTSQTISEMVDDLLGLEEGSRLTLLAPVLTHRKGEHRQLIDGLRAQGFVRARLQTESADFRDIELDQCPSLDPQKHHSIDLVIDRLRIRPDAQQRLAESLEMALRLGQDRAIALVQPDGDAPGKDKKQAPNTSPGSGRLWSGERVLSMRFACPDCGFAIKELEPNLFSFNSPNGACPACDGLGVETLFDVEAIIPMPELSLAAGAIQGWDPRNKFAWATVEALAEALEFDPQEPFSQLAPEIQQVLLHGSGSKSLKLRIPNSKGELVVENRPFEGILPNLERRWRQTDSNAVREELGRLRRQRVCGQCQGSRLKAEARSVRLGEAGQDISLPELVELSLSQLIEKLGLLRLEGFRKTVAQGLLTEIHSRLRFLIDVGLGYLQLGRSAMTLSGGEAQRIRLASQIGAGLSGVLYVLDEPSIGLHPRDSQRLMESLYRLRDLGNSLIVVEHDEQAIRQADHLVDLGPGAGVHGGEVVAAGRPEEVMHVPRSLTGDYLAGRKCIDVPIKRREPSDRWLELHGARGNNLKNLALRIPLGLMVGITGVSGSGKSTLINDTLVAAVAQRLNGRQVEPEPFDRLEGLEHIDRLINVDQSPIGRTPRSNPATYTGLLTPIRELFAETIMARERGYDAGRFSFNTKGGRCEACQGDGLIKVEMHFLPDLYVACDICKGLRYNRETLDVRYRGKTIAEVLDLTIEEACGFFSAVPHVARRLDTLNEVGLGYIKLGQSATTLSGGEAQRVKLACELSKRGTGKTLYVLDEPTTGLHFHDTAVLLNLLNRLTEAGNTVLVIEHNLDVIKVCDWLIDIGPEGGLEGGQIVAQGSPEVLAQTAKQTGSYTGTFLQTILLQRQPESQS